MKYFDTGVTLYKRDSNGKVRQWRAETGTNGFDWGWRTCAGLTDGKNVTSDWTYVDAKNIGKANETSLKDQAWSELAAEYTKKRKRGYFEDIANIDTHDKFVPMLAQKYDGLKFNWTEPVFAQPKLDGIRCIARVDGLWTRTGKAITSAPHIIEAVQPMFDINPDAIFDGELYNHDLRDNFNEITSIVRQAKPTVDDLAKSKQWIQYHIYDWLQDEASSDPFIDRQSDLNALADQCELDCPIRIVETVGVHNEYELDKMYGEYIENGYEGQMVRFATSLYENKRSKNLLKRKEFISDEFRVVQILEGNGNWNGCVKHLELKLADGRPFKSGIRGKKDVLRAMWDHQTKPDWATIRYFTPTPDGMPRFPVAVDWGTGSRVD